MKLFFFIIFFKFIFLQNLFAETLANCGASKGISYFPFSGINLKKNSGFADDEIKDGIVTLTKQGDKYDILFKDASGILSSSTQDGAEIYPIILNQESIALVSIYPGKALEIYSFWKENDGNTRYSLQTSRHGNPLISKSSLLVGDCTFLTPK